MAKAHDLNKTAERRELTDRELDTVAAGGSAAPGDIEQVLNIRSQSSGAGAGKVKFNPLSITR